MSIPGKNLELDAAVVAACEGEEALAGGGGSHKGSASFLRVRNRRLVKCVGEGKTGGCK